MGSIFIPVLLVDLDRGCHIAWYLIFLVLHSLPHCFPLRSEMLVLYFGCVSKKLTIQVFISPPVEPLKSLIFSSTGRRLLWYQTIERWWFTCLYMGERKVWNIWFHRQWVIILYERDPVWLSCVDSYCLAVLRQAGRKDMEAIGSDRANQPHSHTLSSQQEAWMHLSRKNYTEVRHPD